jgi:predicted molibdopterin-dependent oxidoreductase YjgC
MDGERVVRPFIKGRDGMQAPVTWDDAVRSINATLKEASEKHGPDSILGFASPSATNEALYLFKHYLSGRFGASRFEFRTDSEDKRATMAEDDVLRHLDKHPNSMGALNLGLASEELGGIEGAIEAARSGRIKAGVVMYYKPLVPRPGDEEAEARVSELVRSLEYCVVLASHRAEWQSDAGVVLPVAAWSEEEGTYTNYQGRVQFAGKAINPGGDIQPVWEVFANLLYASGDNALWLSVDDVFGKLSETVPGYRGVTLGEAKTSGALPTP